MMIMIITGECHAALTSCKELGGALSDIWQRWMTALWALDWHREMVINNWRGHRLPGIAVISNTAKRRDNLFLEWMLSQSADRYINAW